MLTVRLPVGYRMHISNARERANLALCGNVGSGNNPVVADMVLLKPNPKAADGVRQFDEHGSTGGRNPVNRRAD